MHSAKKTALFNEWGGLLVTPVEGSVFSFQKPDAKKDAEKNQASGTEQHSRQEFLGGGEKKHGYGNQKIDHKNEDQGVYPLVHRMLFRSKYRKINSDTTGLGKLPSLKSDPAGQGASPIFVRSFHC